MFNQAKRSLRNAGFTMIELLVVIAVIGVLAVAVLSSINPIEQINKGRDTRSRSDAAQLISAVDRFFSIHEIYPWNTDSAGEDNTFAEGWTYTADGTGYPVGSTDYRDAFEFWEADENVTDNSSWAWALPLVQTAEVKDSYVNRIAQVADNTDFYVYKPVGPNKTMYVCFNPSSYAFDLEATNRCTPDTTTYDAQLANDVPDACGSRDIGEDTVSCIDSTSDDAKCWICLP